MARTPQEIAADIKAATQTIGKTFADVANAVTGGSPPASPRPGIEVRLDDGRTVELGALADELIQSLER